MSQSRDDAAKKQGEVLEATKTAVQTASLEIEGLKHKKGEVARKSSVELSERLMRMLLRLDGLTGGPEWVTVQRKELVSKVQALIYRVDGMGHAGGASASQKGPEAMLKSMQIGPSEGKTQQQKQQQQQQQEPKQPQPVVQQGQSKQPEKTTLEKAQLVGTSIEEARKRAALRKAALAEEEKRKAKEAEEARAKLEAQWDSLSTFPVAAVHRYLAPPEPKPREVVKKPIHEGAKLPVFSPELSTFHPSQVVRPPNKYGKSAP